MNAENCECSLNEVEFFTAIPKQVVLDEANFVQVYPTNNVQNDTGPIEFKVCGTPDHFLDLNNTMLELTVKITNAKGGEALIANELVAPVNNWLSSMFEDVHLHIGDKAVEGGDHMFPYKAYLTHLFSHSKASKETQLLASGWHPDKAGKFENAADNTTGFKARAELTKLSNKVQLCGPLPLDLFLQNKYLLHNTDLKLKLSRASPEFQVKIRTGTLENKSEAVRVDITDAKLHIRQVKPMPSFLNSVSSNLMAQNAVYPVQHTEMITYTIPKGNMSHNKTPLFNGKVPKVMFVTMVDNAAYNGSYTKEPFNFQHFHCNSITLYENSSAKPFNTFTPDFTVAKKYMLEYQALMQTLNIFNKADDVDLTPEQFANGYTVFGFNLTPDLDISGHSQVSRDGVLRLDIRFATALSQTINVIIMGIFDGVVEITKSRDVHVNWKA